MASGVKGAAGGDLAASLAAKAAEDPRVQKAVADQVYQRGQAAAQAGQVAYCESFSVYFDLLKTRPQLTPFAETCACSKETPEQWTLLFAKWNPIFCQLHILLFPIYVVIFFVLCLLDFYIWTLLTGIFWHILYVLGVLIFSHMSHYCVVSREGGCGNCGYASYILIYLSLTMSVVFMDVGVEGENVLQWVYAITVLPTFFLVLACWKLGGGAAIKGACASLANCIRNKTSGAGGAREAGVGAATQAPSSNPAAQPLA